ncbi:MAG: protein BatD, partial [Ignavibacteria bacterium]
MTKAIKISLVIFVIVCSNLFAQKFTLTADKTTVGEYESFQVYFEFSGGDINKAENFVAPTFENFRVLGGPNQSTSMQIINGKVSGSLSYSYVLRPQKTGTFTIGPGFINYEGKKYTTGTIKIKVVKGKAPAQRKAQNNR